MTLKDQAIKTALEGKWEEAININKTLLLECPNDIDTLNRLALAYIVVGKMDKAKSTYQKVFKLDPLNHIAIKNLKCLKEKISNTKLNNIPFKIQLNNNFLEETGKTKVIELVNIATPKITQSLRTGQCTTLCIKRLKIFVLNDENQYIGVFPDDIGKRLIRFIKNGNKYEAYIKSSDAHKVIIFIKEIKRATRFKDHPSFSIIADTGLNLDKKLKKASSKKNGCED